MPEADAQGLALAVPEDEGLGAVGAVDLDDLGERGRVGDDVTDPLRRIISVDGCLRPGFPVAGAGPCPARSRSVRETRR